MAVLRIEIILTQYCHFIIVAMGCGIIDSRIRQCHIHSRSECIQNTNHVGDLVAEVAAGVFHPVGTGNYNLAETCGVGTMMNHHIVLRGASLRDGDAAKSEQFGYGSSRRVSCQHCSGVAAVKRQLGNLIVDDGSDAVVDADDMRHHGTFVSTSIGHRIGTSHLNRTAIGGRVGHERESQVCCCGAEV